MDSKETGKLSGANLLVLSLRKGCEKKLEIEKLRQRGRGKESHQARTVHVGQSASIPDTRFGRVNDCATIHVDQALRLSCICLQKTATAEETLLGKEAFELCARERGVTI
jgi:hypothetical protein